MNQQRSRTSNPEAFMVVKEGAFMLGCSVFWLYQRLRGENPPPHVKRGHTWLLPRREFTEWAQQRHIE